MRVTHQACRYTHLARKSMQNTGKSQGETDIHCTFYAELFENNALVVTYSTDVSGLPPIWLVNIRECLHVHITWLSLVPYLDFVNQSAREHLF